MKKLLIATIIAATTSFAATAATSVNKDVMFNEGIERVCGLKIDNRDGSIEFAEGDTVSEQGAMFSVYDNGTTNGNTLVSVGISDVSFTGDYQDHLDFGKIENSISFKINGNDQKIDAGDKFNLWVVGTNDGGSNEIYPFVNMNSRHLPAGDMNIISTITVHCGK